MAKTHQKRPLGISVLFNPNLSSWAFHELEGASQTFAAGTPVTWSAGLIVAATDPISTDDNSLVGIAIRAGQNAASGAISKFIPVVDGVICYGNFMTGDGATNVLAAADLGDAAGSALSSKSGFVVSGTTDWFLDDADTNGCTVVSFKSDIILPNNESDLAVAGDSDARVGFIFIDGVRLFD